MSFNKRLTHGFVAESGGRLPGLGIQVVTIGTIYTAFRLWQLWQGQQLIYEAIQNSSNHKLIKALLWLLGLFWFSNAIVLLTLAGLAY